MGVPPPGQDGVHPRSQVRIGVPPLTQQVTLGQFMPRAGTPLAVSRRRTVLFKIFLWYCFIQYHFLCVIAKCLMINISTISYLSSTADPGVEPRKTCHPRRSHKMSKDGNRSNYVGFYVSWSSSYEFLNPPLLPLSASSV